MNICVFASSSNNLDDCFYRDAADVGKLLGQNSINIVYGGSRLGMMYACASQVKENGGRIIGVMPKRLVDFGVANPDDCDEFYMTSGMRERKAKMDECSDGVIALAGGFGTLEELSEMIVQKQLGYTKKPIILLNTNGFYNNLSAFFETIIQKGFAKSNIRELYYIAQTPQETIDYLKAYSPNSLNYSGKF